MDQTTALVHQIIDEALATPPEQYRLPFGHLDTVVMKAMYDELSESYSSEVVLEAMDRVRHRVYGSGRGSDLRQLHTVIKNCSSCPARCNPSELPRGNLVNPVIVAITETTNLYKEVSDLLASAGAPVSELVITSLVRCGFGAPLGDEVYDRCSRYVFSEIGLWSPRLTILVGSVVAKAFLGSSFSVSEDHGRVVWVGPYAMLGIFAPGWLTYQPPSSNRTAEFMADLVRAVQFAYPN